MRKFLPGVLLSAAAAAVILFLVNHGGCLLLKNQRVYRPRLVTGTVQVSAGTFVPYERYIAAWDLKYGSFTAVHVMRCEDAAFYQKDTYYLRIPWHGENILWVGLGVPIAVREYKGHLYMIVFDRETEYRKIRFRYYRQADNTFLEIAADEYPREIAVQNLWLGDQYAKEAVMKLDPDDTHFQRSLTAKIWRQLETHREYYEMDYTIEAEFLRGYLEKYEVRRLDLVVSED